MGDVQQEPDPGQGELEEGMWPPPANQNAALLAEAAPAVVSRSQGAGFMGGGHGGYVVQHSQFDGTSYQELRPSFSGAYQLSAANQDLLQAAHSTYGGLTPPPQTGFDQGDSEAIPAYSMAADRGTHIMAASTVDSSSLQQGYLVLDQDHQVVAVQRVVSPADCTVTQSTLGGEGDGQPTTTLITMPAMSSGSPYVMQVSMPSFPAQETASVSSSERDGVSSLGAGMLSCKVELGPTQGECDTTQGDLDCHPHTAAAAFLQTVSLSGHHSVGMESGGLHTTMMAQPPPAPPSPPLSHNSTIDSSQLSTLQAVPMATATGVKVDSSSSGGHLGRLVDGRHMADALEEATVSASGVPEVAMEEAQPYHPMVATATVTMGNRDDNQPSTSGTAMPAPRQAGLRKSSRLAQFQRQETDSRATRQTYEPRQYSALELWCEECQTAYEEGCPTHRLSAVADKVVLSRAWASLPTMLQIFRLGVEEDGSTEMGVFAKKSITKMTQFGPFIAELVDSPDLVTQKAFLLMLERGDGRCEYFETRDENRCNWMMFVRPAATFAEQNLVAYQHGQDIFFTVSRNIEPRQELKVWYAAPYAERLGLKAHEPTASDLDLLDAQTWRFHCSACSRRFRTAPALQRHLLEHEEEEGAGGEVEATKGEEEEEEEAPRRGRRKAGVGGKTSLVKGRGRQNGDAATAYQWKKKSTSIYINKTLKKYQKRSGSDMVRQTIKSLYRRRGRGSGGAEWVCTHCDLTFDNSSVLNLHTLTHAAEDVGLDEIRRLAGETTGLETGENGDVGQVKAEGAGEEPGQMMGVSEGEVAVETCLTCPMCRARFEDKRGLIEHAAEHARTPRPERPFKCHLCWKAFPVKEKLQKHLLCHGGDESKPLACDFCPKRFMNNSALACHLKTHSHNKYYQCPLCRDGFDNISCLKQHVVGHADSAGRFTCRVCSKAFDDYHAIRKHMRSFHSEKKYPCPDCNKVFPRPDKLKLHMLRHTTHREFMCETCGRQFKRRDKLKEHMKRLHSEDRMSRLVPPPHKDSAGKKFIPRVSPSEYHRFIYKCHTCLLGFKRRGMLVNHLNKRHPNIKPESVHELSLPLLKQQRDYYCQHCDKVYRSSSKRKAHILKNHPGAELPASGRKRAVVEAVEAPGLMNPNFSQASGCITTMPHACQFCHKQYASKPKLMQHQRKSHPELVPAAQERRKAPDGKDDIIIADISVAPGDGTTDRFEDEVLGAGAAGGADLLTQAMTELMTSHDFRSGGNITIHAPDTIQLGRFVTAGPAPTLLQVQPNGTLQPATIELSQLTQALGGHAAPLGTTTLIAPPHNQQPISISMVTTNTSAALPVSIQPGQTFVPRTWAPTIQTIQR